MSFGIHFADINYKWVTFFITQQHWVSVIKLLPNFPAYHFLIPIGLTASLVVQRFSELTHIPTEEIRSRGDFFPSTPPGLCGPAAALALLRKFKLKHFSRTKYFLDRCTNHLYDYSHSGIFEILQYAASLDTLFSADEGEISSSAGGNLSSSHTQSAQELIQRTIIQRNLIRYMTPLAPAEYLSDADIQNFHSSTPTSICWPSCTYSPRPSSFSLSSLPTIQLYYLLYYSTYLASIPQIWSTTYTLCSPSRIWPSTRNSFPLLHGFRVYSIFTSTTLRRMEWF